MLSFSESQKNTTQHFFTITTLTLDDFVYFVIYFDVYFYLIKTLNIGNCLVMGFFHHGIPS